MAINKNHEFEELDGIKCGIVERNISLTRADFLKAILEENGYTVVIAKSPAPKTPKLATPDNATSAPQDNSDAVVPELLTLGVTDVTFNPVNAIFGRLLRTQGNKVVTFSYWHQRELVPDDNEPYFKKPQPC